MASAVSAQASPDDDPASRRGDRRGLPLIGLALALVVGCGAAEPPQAGAPLEVPATATPTTLPRTDLDLDQLRERGTLRVMLRNSSSSYYILRGEEHGFEFELARAVARKLGLSLRVVLPDSATHAVDALNLGHVDVVAMPFTDDTARPFGSVTTRTYDTGQEMIVTRTELADELQTRADLAGRMVAATRLSSGESSLFDLRREGIAAGIVMHPPRTPVEELLDLVADGTYPAAAADDRALAAVMRFRPNLVEAFALGAPRPLHWLVRETSPDLKVAIDAVLTQHFRPRGDGTYAGSAFYNVIRDRYFGDEGQIHEHATDPFRLSHTGRISPFDDTFRAAADSFGLDWRLLAAIGFQESRFDATAVSWAGAVGVMQVKPTTARLEIEELHDAVTNIQAGARHLRWLLDRYEYVPEPDRVRFALAAYNCGHGHLDDARILAVRRGKDPNQWAGSVRESLMLLRKPKYYEESRYGYVRSEETEAYVREVERRHDLLRQMTNRVRRSVGAAASWGATR